MQVTLTLARFRRSRTHIVPNGARQNKASQIFDAVVYVCIYIRVQCAAKKVILPSVLKKSLQFVIIILST